MKKYLAFEIGGTKQQIALGTADGNVETIETVKLGSYVSATDILTWMESALRDYLRRYEVNAIGVGYGGPVELETGKVIQSMQVPGWEDFELRRWLQEKSSLPCVVVNDSDAAAYGEYLCGAGKGSSRMLYCNVGTGIGGGFCSGSYYCIGSGRGAIEIGHSYVPDWTSSKVRPEKLENICSGMSIEKRLNLPGYIPKNSMLSVFEHISCINLADAVEAGDPFAISEFSKITESIGLALSNAIDILAPDTVVIGGGLANIGVLFIKSIEKEIDSRVYPAFKKHYKIKSSELLDRAVIVGALLCASKQEK